MTTTQIRQRISEIDSIVAGLVDEKQTWLCKKEVIDKWSEKSIEQRLRAAIVEQFGLNRIKLAVFKITSEYDDNWYAYHPSLTLVDAHFNHIEHNIDLNQFVPDEDEQWEYEDLTEDNISIHNITIRF